MVKKPTALKRTVNYIALGAICGFGLVSVILKALGKNWYVCEWKLLVFLLNGNQHVFLAYLYEPV